MLLVLEDQITPFIKHSLYYIKACNEFAGPISASLRLGNTALFKEMLQRWQEVGNTVSDLTRLKFEPSASEANALPLDLLRLVITTKLSIKLLLSSVFGVFIGPSSEYK